MKKLARAELEEELRDLELSSPALLIQQEDPTASRALLDRIASIRQQAANEDIPFFLERVAQILRDANFDDAKVAEIITLAGDDLGMNAISSEELLGGKAELLIQHEGCIYRLRITQNGKLILTK